MLGTTATGKTSVAIALAKQLDGEIINADSRSIYRGMDIGTAKPTSEERAEVPHHLIDICDLDEVYDVYQFRQDVAECIEKLLSQGKRPIIVGGSTLYLRALTEGVLEGAGADREIRQRLELLSTDALFEQLQNVDSDYASEVDRHNRVRLIRALEVFEQTGKSIRELQTTAEALPFRFKKFGLFLDREKLYERINKRVNKMMMQGLLQEAERLHSTLTSDLPAYRTIGYQEFFRYFDKEISLDAAVNKIKQHTRNYAKRQTTWHRKDESIAWLDVDNQTAEQLVENMMEVLSQST